MGPLKPATECRVVLNCSHDRRQAILTAVGVHIFNDDVFPVRISNLAQSMAECVEAGREKGGRLHTEEHYSRDFLRLLCLCHSPAKRDREDDCKEPRPFWIFRFGF